MGPPFIGVAAKLTDVPGHIVVADGAIDTVGMTLSFTVIRMLLLVTEAGEGQVAFDVIITVTLSLLVRPVEVKVELLVPTLTPFTCH